MCSTWSPALPIARMRCARHADRVSDDATTEVRALIDEVLTTGSLAARGRLEQRLHAISDRLALGDDAPAADEALTYLEADPYYFWSGYTRAKITRRLADAPLDSIQRERARRYVLDCVDGTKHCSYSEVAQLAGSVADNRMRKALRSRLHLSDTRVARRALRSITKVRHPGLTDADVTVARHLVLADATRTPWLSPNVERLARWLWTPDWEAELRDLTQHHGPERAPAKKLIESMDRRRARRPGP